MDERGTIPVLHERQNNLLKVTISTEERNYIKKGEVRHKTDLESSVEE
jgi:hypothetical protein